MEPMFFFAAPTNSSTVIKLNYQMTLSHLGIAKLSALYAIIAS